MRISLLTGRNAEPRQLAEQENSANHCMPSEAIPSAQVQHCSSPGRSHSLACCTEPSDLPLIPFVAPIVEKLVQCIGQQPDQLGWSPTDARLKGVVSKGGGNASPTGVVR